MGLLQVGGHREVERVLGQRQPGLAALGVREQHRRGLHGDDQLCRATGHRGRLQPVDDLAGVQVLQTVLSHQVLLAVGRRGGGAAPAQDQHEGHEDPGEGREKDWSRTHADHP